MDRKSCYIAKPCGDFRTDDERDTTSIPQSCQSIIAKKVKSVKATAFGARLLQAFKGSSKAEIARALGIGSSTVTDYIRGSSKPTADGLIRIAEITKCDLHWLLTGEGKENVGSFGSLTAAQRRVLESVARHRKISLEDLLQEIVVGGLVARANDLFSRYRRLRPSEVDELQLLFELVRQEDQQSESKVSRTG